MKENKIIQNYTISLIRYILDGDIPSIPKDVDYEELYQFAQNHDVENVVYAAIKDLNISLPKETLEKYEESYDTAIMIEATQALELEEISKSFEEAGIDFLPLKGSVVKYLYPDPSYRKSGDIDILIKPKDQSKADEILISQGYVVDELDEYELHVGYRKPPIIIVELHGKLVEKKNRAYKYFSNIWDRAVLEEGYKHRYLMTNEDFYTFCVAHFAKHIKMRGAGIKFVLDLKVITDKWKIDDLILNSALEEANVKKFAEWAKGVVDIWFNDKNERDRNVIALQDYILDSGTFGNKEQMMKLHSAIVVNKSKKEKKVYIIKYIIKNFFLPYYEMRNKYNILIKHRWMLPFFWCVRAFEVLSDKNRYKEKVQYIEDIDKDSESLKDILDEVI